MLKPAIYVLTVKKPQTPVIAGIPGNTLFAGSVEKPSVSSGVSGNGILGISAGYSFTQIISPWEDVYNDSFVGMNMLLIMDISYLSSMREVSIVSKTDAEFEINYVNLEGKERTGIIRTDMKLIMIGGNIFFRIPVIADSSIRIKAGGGIALTSVESSYHDKSNSQDFYYSAGIYYNIPIIKLLFAEAGASYLQILYIDRKMSTIKYSAGIAIFL